MDTSPLPRDIATEGDPKTLHLCCMGTAMVRGMGIWHFFEKLGYLGGGSRYFSQGVS